MTIQVLAGVIVGPEVLGLIRPETLQPSLSAVVGVAVAVIVFDGAFDQTFPASTTVLWAVDTLLDWTATPDWLAALVTEGHVTEIELNQDTSGRTVESFQQALPDRCFVVAVTRNGRPTLPDSTYTLEADDRVTLLGVRAAVDAAVQQWT